MSDYDYCEAIERVGRLACDLLDALQPWEMQRQEVRSAATRLTVGLAAIPLPPRPAVSEPEEDAER